MATSLSQLPGPAILRQTSLALAGQVRFPDLLEHDSASKARSPRISLALCRNLIPIRDHGTRFVRGVCQFQCGGVGGIRPLRVWQVHDGNSVWLVTPKELCLRSAEVTSGRDGREAASQAAALCGFVCSNNLGSIGEAIFVIRIVVHDNDAHVTRWLE